MKNIIIFIISLCFFYQVYGQDLKTYQTRNGKIGISVHYYDSLLHMGSNKLLMVLDQDNANLFIRLPVSSIDTKVDSLNRKLKSTFVEDVEFKGRLGIDYVNPGNHALQEFEIIGNLKINNITKEVVMQGRLQHWEEGPQVQCMLYIHFDLSLSDYKLHDHLNGFEDQACIEILQAVLKYENK